MRARRHVDTTVSYRRSDYAYDLPPERIALRPATPRVAARLMVVRRHADPAAPVEHTTIAALGRYLDAGDCLVLNETRVRRARFYGVRWGSGGKIELLLVRRADDAEATPGEAAQLWEVLCRPAKHMQPGQRFLLADGRIHGEVRGYEGPGRRLVWLAPAGGAGAPLDALLDEAGRVPLPPYIRRPDDERDRDDYQTTYARVAGAVAAPTAGLHLTPELLGELEAAGIRIARLVLHVGPGTFTPVTTDDVREHRLDAEPFELPESAAATINACRARGGRIVAVGTTVVRVLETQARRAAGLRGEAAAPAAASAPATAPTVVAGRGETALFIHPPFTFRAIDAMLTNFHLPESTLLMLVAAFAGRERILDAYAQAVTAGYRFYSYGDATLLI